MPKLGDSIAWNWNGKKKIENKIKHFLSDIPTDAINGNTSKRKLYTILRAVWALPPCWQDKRNWMAVTELDFKWSYAEPCEFCTDFINLNPFGVGTFYRMLLSVKWPFRSHCVRLSGIRSNVRAPSIHLTTQKTIDLLLLQALNKIVNGTLLVLAK